MTDEADQGAEHRPLILDEHADDDAAALARLRTTRSIRILDLRDPLRAELAKVCDPPEGPESDRWVYYPWRRVLVGLPGPRTFRAVRLDRNRNKLTRAEQAALGRMKVGIVGQSVGHAIAHTLALEGSCGLLRLADFDDIELSNLNRVPGTLFDIGVNKAVVTARRIAELDPYLPVEVMTCGVEDGSVDEFLHGLTLVLEECDSLDVKFAVREGARRHRLPLLMDTSDRGLFDVERYDLEPDRPPFHGLLGATTAADLRGLTTKEKAPHVMRILDPGELSARMAASLAEIDETVTTWPQLGGDVQLGAAIAATAVRRIGLGLKLSSGRTRVDLERALDGLAEPAPVEDLVWDDGPEPGLLPPGPPRAKVAGTAQRAPSGGNVQPWTLHLTDEELRIALDPGRSSAMDIGYRGSAVAIGAALHNARAAAAAHGLLGEHRLIEDESAPLTAVLRFGAGSDQLLARDYPAALTRATNRRLGTGAPIRDGVLAALAAAARAAGGRLHTVTDRAALAEAAELLGGSDRARFLTPRLHQEMFEELRGPGEDLRDGIDLRSMELAPDEHAKLRIAARSDVMDRLREWSGGRALGELTRDRVLSSSALVAVTLPCEGGRDAASLSDYARAGAALERVWLEAGRRGLAVQPVSPVFLYAHRAEELTAISEDFADTLASLQGRFLDLLGVPGHEIMALVLRLSYAAAATVRSRRLPAPGAGQGS
ncbi:Rv1355c family protein [Nocardia farcinica]|uniref:Rv1355c family protein n=1 Tax=Nocardia farcinica TaxID=37329 RepID=UPI0024538853|nr:Rv1355c family protein [Nocardia farcinica]